MQLAHPRQDADTEAGGIRVIAAVASCGVRDAFAIEPVCIEQRYIISVQTRSGVAQQRGRQIGLGAGGLRKPDCEEQKQR